ncbi:S8 family serine peptidase [Patescibacteria group bacterium]|nr:S8 family serine peptidase [Patescibacteria group bacterium]
MWHFSLFISLLGVGFAWGFPVFGAIVVPNDPYQGRQWYLRQVHAPEAWSITTGSSRVVVAVLDGGVDITHPELKDNIWQNPTEVPGDGIDNDGNGFIDDIHGWNFMNHSTSVLPMIAPGDQSEEVWSHGTFVASLIGARGDNGMGISGVAWQVRLMPLVVLDGGGFGNAQSVVDALRYAIEKRVDIINLSLSGTEYDQGLADALKEAREAGILVVAATGNNSISAAGVNIDDHPVYPVCMDGGVNAVLGVGGTDTLDQKAPYANYGSACTDIVAPAQEFFGARPSYRRPSDPSTTTANYLDGMTGTSLAAPLVSGAAALLKSVRPDFTARELQEALLFTADPIEDNLTLEQRGRMGAGRLNIARALARVAPSLVAPPSDYRLDIRGSVSLFSARVDSAWRSWINSGEAAFSQWSTSTVPYAVFVSATSTQWQRSVWDPATNQVTSTILWQARSRTPAPVRISTGKMVLTVPVPTSTGLVLIDLVTGQERSVVLPSSFGRSVVQTMWWPEQKSWIVRSNTRKGVLVDESGHVRADLIFSPTKARSGEYLLLEKGQLRIVDAKGKKGIVVRVRAK